MCLHFLAKNDKQVQNPILTQEYICHGRLLQIIDKLFVLSLQTRNVFKE